VKEVADNKFNTLCPFSAFEPHRLAPSRAFGDFLFKHGPVALSKADPVRGEGGEEEERVAVGVGVGGGASGTDEGQLPSLLPPSQQAVTCLPDVVVRQRSKRYKKYLFVYCAPA
jgi:hypothetical protein